MKITTLIFLFISFSTLTIGQDVEIGTSMDNSNLVMQNGVVVLDSKNDSITGALKFDQGVFWGFDGSSWLNLSHPPKKEILGYSNTVSNGRFSFNGKTGIEAANEMCKDSYPNEPTAHFYFPHEIDEALLNNLISGTTDGTAFWVFKHDFEGFTDNDGIDSRRNNCWCFSFNSGDIADGVIGRIYLNEVTPGNGGGIIANQIRYQNALACNASFPVLCGK